MLKIITDFPFQFHLEPAPRMPSEVWPHYIRLWCLLESIHIVHSRHKQIRKPCSQLRTVGSRFANLFLLAPAVVVILCIWCLVQRHVSHLVCPRQEIPYPNLWFIHCQVSWTRATLHITYFNRKFQNELLYLFTWVKLNLVRNGGYRLRKTGDDEAAIINDDRVPPPVWSIFTLRFCELWPFS